MKKQVLLLLLGILVLTSCNHYESKVPISPSGNSVIEKSLLGEWILSSENKKEEASGYIEVIPFNDTEYLVQLKEIADSTKNIESIINIRMFSSEVNENVYFNMQFVGSDSDKGFMIYRYKPIAGNRYKVFFLSKDQFNKVFPNSKSFKEYIETHTKEFEKYFDVEGILERKIK
ncbi:hypothetical protein [Labilibaculum euxinus]|uniref:Lipocalin-like domain-containing protein n=1 Tax=Labilibaculum euxinus TaxID=2686357 RepID=A0A7M4D2F9_9BACT|nr:hypothetical protein [Labilibaculum euxinus]MUP36838.1 hypothetical protein [Labilibaculum euxinus]MVB06043.1 hypothetical protein [Labilibaculum euxinus]